MGNKIPAYFYLISQTPIEVTDGGIYFNKVTNELFIGINGSLKKIIFTETDTKVNFTQGIKLNNTPIVVNGDVINFGE